MNTAIIDHEMLFVPIRNKCFLTLVERYHYQFVAATLRYYHQLLHESTKINNMKDYNGVVTENKGDS